MNRHGRGYLIVVLPDNTAGRPLTPGEQAAIVDLERRLLLDTPVPGHALPNVVRPLRPYRSPRRTTTQPTAAVPLTALLATTCLLVAVLIVVGGGLLGAVAILASVVGTALLWPLLPAQLGGPVRPARRPRRPRGLLGRP